MTNPEANATIDDVAAECIAVRLRMVNRVVTNIYDDALRPLGVKVSQMNILVATAKLGPVRPAEMCKRLHLDVSTLSRNVERMRARGWIEIVPDDDGRAQPFQLSREGENLLQEALPAWSRAQEQVRTLLGPRFVNELNRATKRVRETTAKQ